MLKLIGGILVAGSGVGLAVNMIAEIRQHLLRLYEIRQLLINISGEAALALLPMEHILNQPTLTMWCCKKYADRLLIVLLQKREKAEVKSGGIYFGKIEKNWESVRLNLRLLRMPEMLFLEEI